MKHIYKAIDFLKTPEKSFDSIKGVKLGDAFKFMLAVAVVFAVLSGIVAVGMAVGMIGSYTSMVLPGMGAMLVPVMVVVAVVVGYITIVIGLTIWGLWLHLWAYIFGARKGLEQTMKSVYYGSSPVYLLGWIPIISIIFAVWSMVLQGMGLKKLQEMTTKMAALAIIIAVIIPLIVVGAFLFAMLSSLMMFNPSAIPGY